MSNFEKFGKYILLEKVAAGGMAEVYLAKSAGASGVNKFVAIKRILPQFSSNQEFIDMFQEEAKVSVNLNHSNVVSIYDFGIEKGQFFIVMEFVEGRNLRQIINELKKFNRSIKIEEAVYLIKEAAAGLDHAHRCVDQHTGRPLNITHRDMSPQNIMISFEGEAKVIDFGIAKKSEEGVEGTKAGTLKGKFAYMSPEQAEAEEVDPRTDVFALGIILWELLANDRLFTGSNENAILRKVRECQTPPIRKINPLVPAELERIVTKALAKDRNVRYQTAANLQKDLNRFLNTQYPDFSPHDFSKTIIDCFKTAFQEGREKIIAYSKIEIPDLAFAPPTAAAPVTSAAPTEQKNKASAGELPQTPNPVKPLEKDEPRGLNSSPQVKIDLNGIKDARAQFGKLPGQSHRPQPSSVNLSNPQSLNQINKLSHETNIGYNTRVTQHSQIRPSTKNSENMTDVLMKLVIVAILGFGGYIGYNKFTQKPKLLATKNNLEGQMDLAATASIKLSISSQPSGAQILIDGVDTNRTTPAVVSVTANKEVRITLKKDSYYKYEVKKMLKETGSLAATLQELPIAGFVNINVQNGGAQPVIYINGQRLVEQPPIKRYAVSADSEVKVMAVNPITQLKDEVTIKVQANKETTVDLILGRKK